MKFLESLLPENPVFCLGLFLFGFGLGIIDFGLALCFIGLLFMLSGSEKDASNYPHNEEDE